jgi:hypothetical protein
LERTNLLPWDAKQSSGFFRNLIVRKSFATDKLVLNLVTTPLEGNSSFDTNVVVNVAGDILGDRLAGVVHTLKPVDPKIPEIESVLYGQNLLKEEVRHSLDCRSVFLMLFCFHH